MREAYAPILEILDPATATQTDVENAFRGFEPTGQIPRMVQLFIQLMVYAGIMPAPETKRRTGAVSGASKTSRGKTVERGQAGRAGQPGHPDGDSGHGHQRETPASDQPSAMERAYQSGLENKTAERRDISLGDAGSVTVIVDVRWLDLPDEQFTTLRKLIKDIEALGHSGPDRSEQAEVSP